MATDTSDLYDEQRRIIKQLTSQSPPPPPSIQIQTSPKGDDFRGGVHNLGKDNTKVNLESREVRAPESLRQIIEATENTLKCLDDHVRKWTENTPSQMKDNVFIEELQEKMVKRKELSKQIELKEDICSQKRYFG